ncbi:HAD family hydrolase [Pedococcus sp. KACC 23699]|uniref:HAD family hydrolase n=1 Tax=Pedococcus sp. KACC 23699 TaxID=3149228 RepID=A0AAU7JX22_9MICO
MHATNIRAVSFDVWVTLIRSDPGFKPRRNEDLRLRFAPHLDSVVFDSAVRAYDKKADVLAEKTGSDYGFVDRLALLFNGLEVPFDPSSDAVEEAYVEQERLARLLHPRPYHADLPEMLRDLSSVMPLAVTSNTGMLPGTLMRRLLDQAGFAGVFTHFTFSDEVGVNKPKPGIFAHMLTGLSSTIPTLAAAEVLHVGDNPVADGHGATAFGMQAALVNTTDVVSAPVDAFVKAFLLKVRR